MKPLFTKVLPGLMAAIIAGPVIAARPAIIDDSRPAAMQAREVNNQANSQEADSRPAAATPANSPANDDTPPPTPSAVELMMQRQSGTVLNIEPREIQPGETIAIKRLDLPRRGASMDKVRAELGEPLSTSGPVGEPPITKWIYSDRVVVFEYRSVIHVVSR